MSEEGVLRKRIRDWLDGLGIEALDLKIYIQSLTHRSFAREINIQSRGNGQLEFLGDSVLSFIITSYLYKKYGTYTEGKLSKIRSVLVNNKTLIKIAREIEIDKQILLSENEESCQGRHKDSILADSVEALIGAIYIDQGIKFTIAWVLRNFEEEIEERINTPRISDYKSFLQETIQADYSKLAEYKMTRTGGPGHNQLFYSVVKVDDKIVGRGKGSNKKDSEQDAARDTLKNLYNMDL